MKRNTTLDIAKGIAILLMIVGHCPEIPDMPYRHFIFTFHMPLFFLISGYLYREKKVSESLRRDFRHLMIPYALTCIAILSFYLLVGAVSGDFSSFRGYILASFWGSGSDHSCLIWPDIPSVGAIWFLPALLVCKNVYNILPADNRLAYSSVIFLVATLLGRYVIFIPFSVLSGLSAIIFYAAGDYLKGVTTIKWYYWVIGIICWIVSFQFSQIYLVQPRLDLYYIDVIGAITASIIVYLLSGLIARKEFISSPLSWIGKNSLYILCLHLIDLDCRIAYRLNLTGQGYVTVLLRLFVPVCGVLCIHWVKTITSRRDTALS